MTVVNISLERKTFIGLDILFFVRAFSSHCVGGKPHTTVCCGNGIDNEGR
jgi:hypothetical protein